jgi:hypothetical protein
VVLITSDRDDGLVVDQLEPRDRVPEVGTEPGLELRGWQRT